MRPRHLAPPRAATDKAPGPDNIAPKLLKLISTDVIEPLSYIFNLSFSSGQVPHSLKITT